MAVRQFFDAGRRDPSLIQVGGGGGSNALLLPELVVGCAGRMVFPLCSPAAPPAAAYATARLCVPHPQAPWLYLVETDYVFVRPTLAPGPAEDPAVRPLGFLFPNVAPAAPRHKELLVQRLYPPGLGPIAAVPQTGPSPILARAGEWEALLPRWEGLAAQVRRQPVAHPLGHRGPAGPFVCRTTPPPLDAVLPRSRSPRAGGAQIEADEELVKTLDWVREMYAFSFAAAVERIPLLLQVRRGLASGGAAAARRGAGCSDAKARHDWQGFSSLQVVHASACLPARAAAAAVCCRPAA